MASFYPIQTQPFSLAGAGVAIGDSSVVLSSFKQIDGTTNIVMTDLGTIAFATVEPGNGVQEEQISFTGVTQNANGTATLTGVKHVAFSTPYTQTANFATTHAGGSQLVLANTSGFYEEFPAIPDTATITGVWTFDSTTGRPRLSSDVDTAVLTEFVDFGQLSRQAIAGAANASTVAKGIVQLAVGTQVAAGTSTGSTGASLVPPNNLFNGTTSANIIIPVTNNVGKLSAGFGGSALGLATLDSNTKVVQNPASATTVATANSIPIAGAGGTLASGWVTIPTVAYKNGVDATWNGQTASGTLNIAHGLGTTPKKIRISAVYGLGGVGTLIYSFGSYNGTVSSSIYNYGTIAIPGNSGTTVANMRYDATNSQIATATFDATNIILAWVKEGTGINNNGNAINILWEAEA